MASRLRFLLTLFSVLSTRGPLSSTGGAGAFHPIDFEQLLF